MRLLIWNGCWVLMLCYYIAPPAFVCIGVSFREKIYNRWFYFFHLLVWVIFTYIFQVCFWPCLFFFLARNFPWLLLILDDVVCDAQTTLQFYLKSFLYILKPIYNTFFLLYNIYVSPQYCWILWNLIFLIYIYFF